LRSGDAATADVRVRVRALVALESELAARRRSRTKRDPDPQRDQLIADGRPRDAKSDADGGSALLDGQLTTARRPARPGIGVVEFRPARGRGPAGARPAPPARRDHRVPARAEGR